MGYHFSNGLVYLGKSEARKLAEVVPIKGASRRLSLQPILGLTADLRYTFGLGIIRYNESSMFPVMVRSSTIQLPNQGLT